MTSNDKMQALFDAALKADPAAGKELQRAHLKVDPSKLPADDSEDPFPNAGFAPAAVEASVAELKPAVVPDAERIEAVEFNKKEAEELGALLEEQMERSRRKRKRELLFTLLFLGGSTVGAAGWFVSDADRVEATKAVLSDIRSISDVQSIVAKFQDSLDRVAVRGNQIDQATAALGVAVKPSELKDQYMEEEMKQMMGEEGGKTVGERNRALQKAFSDRAEKAGGAPTTSKKSEALEKFNQDNSFEWGSQKP